MLISCKLTKAVSRTAFSVLDSKTGAWKIFLNEAIILSKSKLELRILVYDLLLGSLINLWTFNPFPLVVLEIPTCTFGQSFIKWYSKNYFKSLYQWNPFNILPLRKCIETVIIMPFTCFQILNNEKISISKN
jgi:hypothetical protein